MSSASTCPFDIFPGLGDPRPLFFSFAIGTLLYGVFTTVFAMSMYILLCKGLKSISNIVVFTTIIIMYTVSTVHWIGISIFAWQKLKLATLSSQLEGLVVMAVDFLPVVNFVLGDAIVVWRAWLVWERSMLVFLVPVASFMGSFATLMVYIVTSAWDVERDGLAVLCVLRDVRFGGLPISYMLAVATNVYATSLVAVKAWSHRRNIKRYMGDGNRRTRVEKLLILLVESGSIYCAILATATTCLWTGKILAALFIHPILTQITGIYPTIIIVLASLQKTHCDRTFAYETPVAFASPQVDVSSTGLGVFDLTAAISMPSSREESRVRAGAGSRKSLSAEDLVADVDRMRKAEGG